MILHLSKKATFISGGYKKTSPIIKKPKNRRLTSAIECLSLEGNLMSFKILWKQHPQGRHEKYVHSSMKIKADRHYRYIEWNLNKYFLISNDKVLLFILLVMLQLRLLLRSIESE